ncbi:lipoprotein N-acyltransferase Lnb domain-containing protein [Flavobacteriaceae bacterium LMO-SS05]
MSLDSLKPTMQLKLTLLLYSFFCVQIAAFAQQLNLSPNAEVSVITVGPGSSLNDAFGHNAFRIKDQSLGLDLAYGYGEYDFDTPNFYLKFAQGKLNYLLSRVEFNRFHNFYRHQNRTLREQVLNLSPSEKQKLFDFLQHNYKLENRRYLYDFFYDNCATRIRDVVEKTSDTNITFHTPQGFESKTFRALIYEHVHKNSWGSLGIDVALGSVIDRPASPYEHMFLPKYIFEFFEQATKNGSESLVKETHTLYQQKKQHAPNDFWLSPLFIFSLIALIILGMTIRDYKNKTRAKVLDSFLFGITGSIGIMVLLLWFATDHTATAQNYNLLWAFPLNLWIMVKLFKKQVRPWVIRYLKFLVIMLCLLAFHWSVGIQVFAIGLLPLFIALCIRYIYLIYHFQQAKKE